MPKVNKRVLKKSVYTAFSRLVSVGLASGAGSIVKQLTGGDGILGWSVAILMAIGSLCLTTYFDYKRDTGDD